MTSHGFLRDQIEGIQAILVKGAQMSRSKNLWPAITDLKFKTYSHAQAGSGLVSSAVSDSSNSTVPGTPAIDARGWMRSSQKVLRQGLLLIAAFSFLYDSAWAQTTGALLGVVSDQNGAVVSSASVRAINTDTGFTTSTVSTSEG